MAEEVVKEIKEPIEGSKCEKCGTPLIRYRQISQDGKKEIYRDVRCSDPLCDYTARDLSE